MSTRSVSTSVGHDALTLSIHGVQSRLVLLQVPALVVEDLIDTVERVRHRQPIGLDVDRRAGNGEDASVAGRVEPAEERPVVDEDARLVAAHQIEVEQVGIEEARRTGARDDGTRPDRLDVAHRARQLAVDLGADQVVQVVVREVVHHRVPDRAAVLQPVQVHRTVVA